MPTARDEARAKLIAEFPRMPETIIDMCLDIHEKDGDYFHKMMRDITRKEKSGKEAKPELVRACPDEFAAIIVEPPEGKSADEGVTSVTVSEITSQ